MKPARFAGIFAAVLIALGGLGTGIYVLLRPDVSGSIQRLERAKDARAEAEAFEYLVRRSGRHTLSLLDQKGSIVPFPTGWTDRNDLTLLISWERADYKHRLIDPKNVLILMRE